MSKSEILLEVEAIRRGCRDLATFGALSDLKERLKREIAQEERNGKQQCSEE